MQQPSGGCSRRSSELPCCGLHDKQHNALITKRLSLAQALNDASCKHVLSNSSQHTAYVVWGKEQQFSVNTTPWDTLQTVAQHAMHHAAMCAPASVLTVMHLSRSVKLTVLSKLAAATLLIWGQCKTDVTLQWYSTPQHDALAWCLRRAAAELYPLNCA